ncbi:alpha/beta hydrolase [Shewanella sp. 10N.286.52.C2]|uniref:alpha/beta fold hydrolase n=1 Tax=unclassified Shewanella TaxID=196818 RepID=UPI000C840401|nr:alpha/beta hydrolase [Shewanella sp. 10N.286.52.C2]
MIDLSFSSEQQLNNDEQQQFWQAVTQAKLRQDNADIAYAFVRNPTTNKAIVISSGRVECYLKYKELMFNIYQQGYSVYILDHRGQGLSSRSQKNNHQGHIDKFQTYIDDFHVFIKQIVQPQAHDALYLVGHSMGGTIGTLYMGQYPSTFNAAVFSAPMYGINLPMNKGFIRSLAKLLNTYTADKEPNYVIGGKNYNATSFADNELTHSQNRYQASIALFEQNPQIQLGSPTNNWLLEAITAADNATQVAATSIKPILILQATEDTIVDNAAQDRAENNLCQLQRIHSSRHEIFMEVDEVRNQALTSMFAFLEQY